MMISRMDKKKAGTTDSDPAAYLKLLVRFLILDLFLSEKQNKIEISAPKIYFGLRKKTNCLVPVCGSDKQTRGRTTVALFLGISWLICRQQAPR